MVSRKKKKHSLTRGVHAQVLQFASDEAQTDGLSQKNTVRCYTEQVSQELTRPNRTRIKTDVK